jgi:hypothetical protein
MKVGLVHNRKLVDEMRKKILIAYPVLRRNKEIAVAVRID